MVGKGGGQPGGGGGMASCAISRKSKVIVVGVVALVVINGVATYAGSWRALVAGSVAFLATGIGMGAGEGESRAVVVENEVGIAGGVAGEASRAVV